MIPDFLDGSTIMMFQKWRVEEFGEVRRPNREIEMWRNKKRQPKQDVKS